MDEFKNLLINRLDGQVSNLADAQVKTIADIFDIKEGDDVLEDEFDVMTESHQIIFYKDTYEFLEEWLWLYLEMPEYLPDGTLDKMINLADEGADEIFDNIVPAMNGKMEIITVGEYYNDRSIITVDY